MRPLCGRNYAVELGHRKKIEGVFYNIGDIAVKL